MIQRLSLYIHKLIERERSPEKLAFMVCLGVYIGICPFAGFHTIMTFVLGWLFRLNIPGLFMVSMLIHNPWTTIPIYAFDHYFGKIFLAFLDIDYVALDPVWIRDCNDFLSHHTGISGLSLSAFLIGGNVLALGTSLLLYPFKKRFFRSYLARNGSKA